MKMRYLTPISIHSLKFVKDQKHASFSKCSLRILLTSIRSISTRRFARCYKFLCNYPDAHTVPNLRRETPVAYVIFRCYPNLGLKIRDDRSLGRTRHLPRQIRWSTDSAFFARAISVFWRCSPGWDSPGTAGGRFHHILQLCPDPVDVLYRLRFRIEDTTPEFERLARDDEFLS
jgi:hypothetical protein